MAVKKRKRPFVSAVIVAAGSAQRMQGVDKQLASLDGMPVVIRSILAFERSNRIDEIVVVTREESIPQLHRLVQDFFAEKVSCIVAGGKNRQESVFNGVQSVSKHCQYVAIHDGARPLLRPEDMEACLLDAVKHGAALLGVPVKDTLKQVDSEGFVARTVSRESLMCAQTPQIFEIGLYRAAMLRAQAQGVQYTDDCQLLEQAGARVHMTRGHSENSKITEPDDMAYAQALLAQKGEEA